jgi:ribosomal protein S18 acetylase RimI-like enzyme
MNHAIVNATVDDLEIIYQLFEEAIQFQQKNKYIGWLSYDKEYIQKDVEENLLFKLVNEESIVCIFSICYSDKLIWRGKEKGDAIYLHRIVLNRTFQGEKGFQKILNWTLGYAKERLLKYIRMDTWAENEKLISYYKTYGFRFIENYTTANTEALPIQHRNLKVALLELDISQVTDSDFNYTKML